MAEEVVVVPFAEPFVEIQVSVDLLGLLSRALLRALFPRLLLVFPSAGFLLLLFFFPLLLSVATSFPLICSGPVHRLPAGCALPMFEYLFQGRFRLCYGHTE